ncbi:unnamed protein product [Paramecium pentaurelia]|uniref:ubiquitinyl hydrolase 1 n=1 Tax=Paramecium pentaurelia TaxID=43138 RepID=A0A8S1U267_9CILI|nr:unnamed protein product [Paramecium pentaurelia]
MQEEKLNEIQVSQHTADKLKKQALEYKKLQETFNKRFSSDANTQFYVLSLKWLNQWKQYVSYDEIVANKAPSKYFGRITLERINDDLEDDVQKCFKYYPINNHPWNTYMKQGLQENVDYVVIDKDIWEFFTSYYPGIAIIRTSNGNGKDKQVAVNLLRFKAVLLYPSIIKQISFDRMYRQTFDSEIMQVDRNMELKDYQALIQRTVHTFSGSFAKDNNVRIWRYVTDQKDPYKVLFNEIYKQVSELESSDDMCFDFKGELLTHQQYQTIEDIGIIDNNLIIFEFKDDFKPWCIRNQAVQVEGKCEYCHNFKVLSFPCICRKVAYCKEECKQNDYNYHSSRCEKHGSDDESIKSLTLTTTSMKGIVGLSNLGNTCFMNSGTQCISNSYPLVEYFLKNLYFDEINMDNPLGTQGQLVKKVGSLIKKMWCGDRQTITPTNYKKAVGQFQPMFKGFHQHDSSELITFVLDGIHEDLNRVKKKPYVETKDYDGRSDFVVAKESWLNHLARNQSIIVDLMHGQYKSTLKCPNCQQFSITFDPYLMVQLGIPSQKKRTISFKFYKDLFQSTLITIPFDKYKNIILKEYLKILGEELKVDHQYLFGYIANMYTSFDFLDENKSIVDIRKSAKRSQLCFRQLTVQEIQMQKKFPIQFSNKHFEQQYKKSYFQSGVIIVDGQMTLKQVHLQIFTHLNQLFSEHEQLDYEKQVLNQYYSLAYKTNQNYWNPCAFCTSKNCNDCEVKFDDETVEEVKNRALKVDHQCNFEIIILWKQSPFKQIKLPDIFDHYFKTNKLEIQDNNQRNQMSSSMNSNSQQGIVSLYDCLQYSQQPEQLNAENTWYCQVCKEHVQAFKSMQIYKAPQILIFTLKRFKASNRLFKQKLETLVDFPINNLDMTDYVINSRTPFEYHNENETNNGENNKQKVIYDLYAVSNHFGGLGGGHYTALAKNKFTNKWYNFDDSMVSEINETSIVSKSAYVLCYQLRTDDSNNCQEKTMQSIIQE